MTGTEDSQNQILMECPTVCLGGVEDETPGNASLGEDNQV